ncbi:replication-relaxation family protein [Niallia sp. Sow4_A1]|uniref:Replication-relaxation family protein n=1 Tax=Mesobacillus jeotgali TaxID=129985 RepID=A0ABY9VEM4_9BACI|nr:MULTISPECIES: replication-relaxation family protein [Bacillaceae]WNF22058.1 replication-relaxation family protein [Mesobacillus jeotgali]
MLDKIVLKKNARQRLELSKVDLKLLEFLEQQRLLTLQQFYQAATFLFEMKIKEYSFKNRIRKYEEYHLIRSSQFNEGFNGERFKYLCIGSKAIDLLIENNLLVSSYNKSKIYKFNQKQNLLHFLATQQAAINILCNLNFEVIKHKNQKKTKYVFLYNETYYSLSPSLLPYTEWIPNFNNLHKQNNGAYHAKIGRYMTENKSRSNIIGKTMTFVKPDWIIEVKSNYAKDAYINIEMDMGTEPIETLIQKVFKYAKWAEKNPEQLHIMDIVITDNSFSNRSQFTDGIKRGKNIINQFAADSAVSDRLKQSNLKVIIHPLLQNENAVHDVLCRF